MQNMKCMFIFCNLRKTNLNSSDIKQNLILEIFPGASLFITWCGSPQILMQMTSKNLMSVFAEMTSSPKERLKSKLQRPIDALHM